MHPFHKAGEAGDVEAVAGPPAENSEIDGFMVMLRPLSAAKARAGARGAKSGSIAREEAGHE
ncbi:hypothetical protein ACWC9R_13885 [Streptomyces sp. NPDC001219]